MSEEKKDVIIKAAQALFARFGLNKTTIDEIAGKAHVAKSTVYNYFRSKEEIFELVIEKESSLLSEEISKVVKRVSDPFEKLKLYFSTRLRCQKEHENYNSALTDEYLQHHPFIEKARRKSLEREINTVKSILRDGLKKGVFHLEDIHLTSLAIVTSAKGLEFPCIGEFKTPDNQKRLNSFFTLLFNGIRKR